MINEVLKDIVPLVIKTSLIPNLNLHPHAISFTKIFSRAEQSFISKCIKILKPMSVQLLTLFGSVDLYH